MIKIQNIYHMLAYAFQILREQGYAHCGTEDFENTADLLSAILVKGVSIQIKRGLGRSYVEQTENGKVVYETGAFYHIVTNEKQERTLFLFNKEVNVK